MGSPIAASQHGITSSEIGDYPGGLLKNSRRDRTGAAASVANQPFEARRDLVGILSVSSRAARPASTTLDQPGQRGAPRRARHAGFKVRRSRAKVWAKALAACELWLNQVANAGAIAYGRYRPK